MSPEQASAGPIDCRSDIWSLAIVIHEMLSGVRPFHGDDGRAVLQAILTEDPDLTATSYPDVPAGMDRVLRRTLARHRTSATPRCRSWRRSCRALATAPDDGIGSHAVGEPSTIQR